ncbi:hypothetical protein NAL33_10065 [Xanthomonas oryzae pv. oryzae]|nr:hypothetical protein NAL33_10065 [Xanthomonas oryzae pv. oryzae]
MRQRVLAVLGAAPIDGVGDCLIGRVRTGKAVVDQVMAMMAELGERGRIPESSSFFGEDVMEPVLGKPPFGKGEIMRGNLKHEGAPGIRARNLY